MNDQAAFPNLLQLRDAASICPSCAFEARKKADQTPTTFDGISFHDRVWSQNATVDPESRARIRQDLSATEQLITAYTKDLSNVGTFLSEMYTSREFLLHSISQHRSLLNPIRSLPGDILLQIFRHIYDSNFSANDRYSDEDFVLTIPDPIQALPPRCIVSQVCRRWRTLALSADVGNTLRYTSDSCPFTADPPSPDPPRHGQTIDEQQALTDEQQTGDHNCPCCSFEARQKVDLLPKAFSDATHRVWLQNAPVDPQDMATFQRDLDISERLLSELDVDVRNVQAVWFRVIATRNDLVQCIPRYHSLLQPLRGLPDDVLLEICHFTLYDTEIHEDDCFFNVHPMNRILVKRDSLHRRAPHWVFSEVCSRWRTLALSCSALWSSIYISVPTKRSHGWLKQRLELLLQRSKSHDLDICFVDTPTFPRSDQASVLFPLLKAHSERWRTLKFQASPHLLNDMVEGSVGRIVTVHLHRPAINYDYRPVTGVLVFGSAPHLRIVHNTLEDVRDFPWPQLSHYNGAIGSFSHLCTLQNICELRLDFPSAVTSFFAGATQCTLPFLERLNVSENGGTRSGASGCIKALLEYVSMPRLRELRMDILRDTSSLPESLPGNLSLVYLDIHFLCPEDPGIITFNMLRLLRMVSSLETLALTGNMMNAALLDGLREGGDLPCLKKISVEGCYLSTFVDALLGFAKSRVGVLEEVQLLRGGYYRLSVMEMLPRWLAASQVKSLLEDIGKAIRIT